MLTAADVRDEYASRAAALRIQRVGEARTVDRLGDLRLAAFAGAALLLARGATTSSVRGAWIGAAVAVAIVFAVLVWRSGRAKVRLAHTDDLIALCDEGALRVARDWSRIPKRAWTAESSEHPYAGDLDVFGDASLVQLVPPLSAAPGRSTLRAWFLAPADPSRIRARQAAVADLRSRTAFRDELAIAGMRTGATPAELERLADWAATVSWIAQRPWLSATCVLIPLVTIALIVVQIRGLVASPYWIAPVLTGLLLTARYGKRLTASAAPVVGRATVLRRYADMSRLIAAEQFASEEVFTLQQRLTGGGRPAYAAIRTLTVLADCTELRLSPMAYVVINTLTLWDFHVAWLLVRWQRESGRRVRDWLVALGEIESLAALATVAHDNPTWAVPQVDATSPAMIEANALGHPLLADDVGVRNDVSVGPAGTILVITGSNMAGKSTLLRSIGLNLVLSQAGSVVCATRFRHPPATLRTSMRVQDSLERGVSYFMAELQRLKLVVDSATTASPAADRVLVYLLDEILHGTNSAERTIAARHVLTHLAGTGAIGAVSTHDLQLVDDPQLATAARHVHFAETFSRRDGVATMTFDYRLQPGKATSSNALKLLEIVGLRGAD
ncbi:MAG TPA: hypothetical protein VIJ16_01495 [Gemmatimonadaceae bacterium]